MSKAESTISVSISRTTGFSYQHWGTTEKIIGLSSQTVTHSISGVPSPQGVVYSPETNKLFVGSDEGKLYIYSATWTRRSHQLFLRFQRRRRSKLIGTRQELPTKSAARRAAEALKPSLAASPSPVYTPSKVPNVAEIVERYRAERMPERASTARGYNTIFRNHILPQWGQRTINNLPPREVELWLKSLSRAPKTRGHIRGLLSNLVAYAMWAGDIPVGTNPLSLVRLSGVSRPAQPRRSLTPDEFQKLADALEEPFRTIAVLSVCTGLRISETCGLRWEDVDWLNGRLSVRRGIVRRIVADTKTVESAKDIPLSSEVLEMLKRLKQATQFGESADWVFGSPTALGRLPLSLSWIEAKFAEASAAAQVGHVSPHVLRHTYRAWMGDLGTGSNSNAKRCATRMSL
jgi:integrase